MAEYGRVCAYDDVRHTQAFKGERVRASMISLLVLCRPRRGADVLVLARAQSRRALGACCSRVRPRLVELLGLVAGAMRVGAGSCSDLAHAARGASREARLRAHVQP